MPADFTKTYETKPAHGALSRSILRTRLESPVLRPDHHGGFCRAGRRLVKAVLLEDLAAFGFTILTILTLSFATAATNYLGVVLRRPVMVELSDQGLAGYGIGFIPWEDIAEVAPCKGRKRHRYLGISLNDPTDALHAKPLLLRLKSRVWQWRYERDLVVEMFLLKTDAAEEIALAARAFCPRAVQ